jgi:hypothetical protein
MKWENFVAFLSWLLRQEIFLTRFFLSKFYCIRHSYSQMNFTKLKWIYTVSNEIGCGWLHIVLIKILQHLMGFLSSFSLWVIKTYISVLAPGQNWDGSYRTDLFIFASVKAIMNSHDPILGNQWMWQSPLSATDHSTNMVWQGFQTTGEPVHGWRPQRHAFCSPQ